MPSAAAAGPVTMVMMRRIRARARDPRPLRPVVSAGCRRRRLLRSRRSCPRRGPRSRLLLLLELHRQGEIPVGIPYVVIDI